MNSQNTPSAFGPQIEKHKLELNKKIKKLIYYDCNPKGDQSVDQDVPDEDEVYIKENLLHRKKDETGGTEYKILI